MEQLLPFILTFSGKRTSRIFRELFILLITDERKWNEFFHVPRSILWVNDDVTNYHQNSKTFRISNLNKSRVTYVNTSWIKIFPMVFHTERHDGLKRKNWRSSDPSRNLGSMPSWSSFFGYEFFFPYPKMILSLLLNASFLKYRKWSIRLSSHIYGV